MWEYHLIPSFLFFFSVSPLIQVFAVVDNKAKTKKDSHSIFFDLRSYRILLPVGVSLEDQKRLSHFGKSGKFPRGFLSISKIRSLKIC